MQNDKIMRAPDSESLRFPASDASFLTAMIKISICSLAIIAGAFALNTGAARAQDHSSSPALTGPLGLNIVPGPRMAAPGTLSAGIATLDPYAHAWLGFQVAAPLYIGVRQTAETSSLNADADRLYPGIDLKLRLLREGPVRPELSIGLQSATGHKRMAAEYIVAAKRWNNFDFTAGLGWGRMGSAAHISNPLKALLGHFGKDRAPDGEMPGGPENWFTGDDIGIFGGVEYFTPVSGLSLKLDYGADRYTAEATAFGFEAPAPWSAGINYRPVDWINLGLAAQGTDKIMARLSVNSLLSGWRGATQKSTDVKPMRPFRTGLTAPGAMEIEARNADVFLQNAQTEGKTARAFLALDPHLSAPAQLGRAAVSMANHAGSEVEQFVILPTVDGLRGPSIRLMRGDFENALLRDQGSAQEIWRNAVFDTDDKDFFARHNRLAETFSGRETLRLVLDNQVSLAEEDNGFLYRTAALAKFRSPRFMGLLDAGTGFRLNLKHNLGHLAALRPPSLLPVRSDVDDFADRFFTMDEAYIAYTHSFRPDLHLVLLGGYLEEMYAGMGGEILYRPFRSRLALGAETWLALKRDPGSMMNLALTGDHLLTGHLNAWYDVPELDITLKARAGRYLAEDVGLTLGLEKIFKNGAKIEAFATVTDQADFDLFGGTTHAYNGVRVSMPLGGLKYIPREASVKLRAEPFGRDTGQALEPPVSLYEMTEPFSYRHLSQNWGDVIAE